jgi:hypothetical protein
MQNKFEPGNGGTTYNEQLVNILLKDYELAASRFDKTDDRIIQLISVGLALFGLVAVVLRQAPSSSPGNATFLATLREFLGTQPYKASNTDVDVLGQCLWACVIFVVGYAVLVRLYTGLWKMGSRHKFAWLKNPASGWLARASGLDSSASKPRPKLQMSKLGALMLLAQRLLY